MEKLLGEKIFIMITKVIDINDITEIRIRCNNELCVKTKDERIFITNISNNKNYIVEQKDIDHILQVASEYSMYSVDNQLIKGFITYSKGIRIGIVGEAVYIDNKIKRFKNINSLVIRLPHEIKGCASKVFNYIYKNGQVNNTLIVSKPGLGKTTLLRDVARMISNSNFDTMIIDERNEIAGKYKNECFDLGKCSDIFTFINKNDAYEICIRACNPEVIIVDELYGEEEFNKINNINNLGICIISTMHFDSTFDIKFSKYYKYIKNIFQYIIFLDCNNVGVVSKIIKVNDV